MTLDMTLWGYFAGAGFAVKTVMLMLFVASVLSWAFIFQQRSMIRTVRFATETFDQMFWQNNETPEQLYEKSFRKNHFPCGSEAVFQAGMRECLRLEKISHCSDIFFANSVARVMHAARLLEEGRLEFRLPFFATVGSIAPFVGIFGTVCGIMLTFRTLAHVQQATIAMVAPGIAEALIATAMGLFAAIPALIAYNRFAAVINRLSSQFEKFEKSLLEILLQHFKNKVK